jgi:hypothetical protein
VKILDPTGESREEDKIMVGIRERMKRLEDEDTKEIILPLNFNGKLFWCL